MSIYDAAPKYVRDAAKRNSVSDIQWFYNQPSDPRPFGERYGIPRDYTKLPAFPWDTPYNQFLQLFG